MCFAYCFILLSYYIRIMFRCGSRSRTYDLKVMSLASYHCSIPLFLGWYRAQYPRFLGLRRRVIDSNTLPYVRRAINSSTPHSVLYSPLLNRPSCFTHNIIPDCHYDWLCTTDTSRKPRRRFTVKPVFSGRGRSRTCVSINLRFILLEIS